MNIPKTIKVGYQKRGDTYTGKLAYVIYTDDKGKLRKEKSWQGWRDGKIKPSDFDNEPTSGFVLNKGVGGGGRGSLRPGHAPVRSPLPIRRDTFGTPGCHRLGCRRLLLR